MAEQKIVITIDENGKISASTEGIKGEMCLAELQELLGDSHNIQSVRKTDEYYQKVLSQQKNTIKQKSI